MFLAGSIEMGSAEDWQALAERKFSEDVLVLNPRRDQWDSSWEQTIKNPDFRDQVAWEIEAQAKVSAVAFYFAPGTKSPITLLELGFAAGRRREGARQCLVVCCPDGFWRKGNVEFMCHEMSIPLLSDMDAFLAALSGLVGPSNAIA